MEQRTLGKTGWQVSVIGFGAWGLGGQWGAVSRETALAALHAAVDAGINFFDTADAYGEPPGRSEELVGEALRPVRDKVFIATKVGNWARRQGYPLPFTSPLHVELCCDASLHRLGLDHVDLYQSHIGNTEHLEVMLAAFDTLLKKGKIRAFGVSTGSLATLKAYNADGRCATVQPEFSLFNLAAEKDVLPYCLDHNIGTIIRGPLAKGVLAGKFAPDTRFEDSVRAGWNAGDERAAFLARLAVVEKLRFLATPQRPLAQAALQFVASHPAVSTIIAGAKSPEQARSNAAAGEGRLSADELDRIRAVLAG